MAELAWSGYLYTEPDSALYFAQMQYNFAKKRGLEDQMARASVTKGTVYSITGDYIEAIKSHQHSLKLYEKNNDKKGVSICLSNIGIVYGYQDNSTMAIDYLERSLAIKKEIGADKSASGTLNNLGLIYKGLGEFDKAIECYTQFLETSRKYKNNTGVSIALNNLGSVYLEIGNYQKSLEYLQESLTISEAIDDKFGIAHSLYNIGRIYFQKNDNENTIKYYLASFSTAEEVSSLVSMEESSYGLYEVYKQNNNPAEALKMHELYLTLRDSILNEKKQEDIISLEFKYKYEKQALSDSLSYVQNQKMEQLKYKAQLDKEKSQRYYLYITLFFVLLIFGVIIKIKSFKDKKDKESLLQEIKVLKAESISKIITSTSITEPTQLNKENIEKAIDAKLNQTDWKILNVLYNNPGISNKQIAEEISLSFDGVRSSLQKMYRLFDIPTSRNQRIVLVIKAFKLSA